MSDRREDVQKSDDNASISSGSADSKTLFKEVNGRVFTNLNDSYLLPSDETEWVRLEKQSVALVIAMGGLYLCPEAVDAILSPSEGHSKHIIDVGCGTGSWAIEMAQRFPHASVVGIDVAPPPVNQAALPPNLQFEIYNVNLGMSRFYDQYDFVHVRCIGGGITDMDRLIVELQRCLKPGGILTILDGEMIVYEGKEKPARMKKLPGDPDVSGLSEDGSWLRRMIAEAWEGCAIDGACVHRSSEITQLGFWDYPLIDPETARSGGAYFPLGPWAQGSRSLDTHLLQYAGESIKKGFLSVHRAYHSKLLQHGLSQDVLNEWSSNIDDELNNPDTRLWIRFVFSWGRRRAGEGLPAPQLSPSQERSSFDNMPQIAPRSGTPRARTTRTIPLEIRDFRRAPGYQYPAIEIFKTKEETYAQWSRKVSQIGELPELVVRKNQRMTQQTPSLSSPST